MPQQQWQCLGCGAPMQAALAAAAEHACRNLPGKHMLQVCGRCKHLHVAEGGQLRELSVAEAFTVHLQFGDVLERIQPGDLIITAHGEKPA